MSVANSEVSREKFFKDLEQKRNRTERQRYLRSLQDASVTLGIHYSLLQKIGTASASLYRTAFKEHEIPGRDYPSLYAVTLALHHLILLSSNEDQKRSKETQHFIAWKEVLVEKIFSLTRVETLHIGENHSIENPNKSPATQGSLTI